MTNDKGLMTDHSEAGDPIVEGYSTISGWAVAAVIVGVLSATALVSPLLWLVPAVGIGIALAAMWRINRSRGDLIGWNMALLGLLLSLMFIVAGPVRTVSRQIWLRARAEQFADGFMNLLQQQQSYLAHQFTLGPDSRHLAVPDLPELYEKDEKMLDGYKAFLKREPAKTLLTEGKRAKFERGSSEVLEDDGNDAVGVRYHITAPDAGGSKNFDASLILERSLSHAGGAEQWQVVRMAEAKN